MRRGGKKALKVPLIYPSTTETNRFAVSFYKFHFVKLDIGLAGVKGARPFGNPFSPYMEWRSLSCRTQKKINGRSFLKLVNPQKTLDFLSR
jgi:hypothetical protein